MNPIDEESCDLTQQARDMGIENFNPSALTDLVSTYFWIKLREERLKDTFDRMSKASFDGIDRMSRVVRLPEQPHMSALELKNTMSLILEAVGALDQEETIEQYEDIGAENFDLVDFLSDVLTVAEYTMVNEDYPELDDDPEAVLPQSNVTMSTCIQPDYYYRACMDVLIETAVSVGYSNDKIENLMDRYSREVIQLGPEELWHEFRALSAQADLVATYIEEKNAGNEVGYMRDRPLLRGLRAVKDIHNMFYGWRDALELNEDDQLKAITDENEAAEAEDADPIIVSMSKRKKQWHEAQMRGAKSGDAKDSGKTVPATAKDEQPEAEEPENGVVVDLGRYRKNKGNGPGPQHGPGTAP